MRSLAYQDNRYLSVLRNGHRQTIAWNVDDYAWSPNGKWLAIDTHTTYPYSAHLEIIRRDGTGERKLTDSYALSLTWSRDGRFIAYSNSGLNVVDLATGGVRPVGPEHGYRHPWSPRGHLLAFDGEQGLSLFDAGTGTTRPLSSDHAAGISWSPDGRSLAYFLDRNLWPFNGDDIRVASLSGDVIAVLPAWQTAGGAMGVLAWTRPAGTTRYRPPEPRNAATVSATEVVAPWNVERIATDGGRVLYTTCGHLFVWTPRTGMVTQAEPAASLSPRCTTPHNYRAFEVYNIAVAGDRLAFGARNGNMSQGWSLYEGPLSDPSALQAIATGYGYAGCTVANQGLGDLVGAGDLLVFSRWREDLPPAACGLAVSQQIYRLDASGCPCPEIASSAGPLLPADVDGGRIVAVGTNAILLLDRTGRQLPAVPVRALAAQLSGPDLVVAVQGELLDYDASSGSLLQSWPLPDVATGGFCGNPHPWACPQTPLVLQDAAHGLAAYVVDGQVHVLRLADGTDVAVGAATTARFMDEGLVYADGEHLRLRTYALLP
jgi:hypothetical protein